MNNKINFAIAGCILTSMLAQEQYVCNNDLRYFAIGGKAGGLYILNNSPFFVGGPSFYYDYYQCDEFGLFINCDVLFGKSSAGLSMTSKEDDPVFVPRSAVSLEVVATGTPTGSTNLAYTRFPRLRCDPDSVVGKYSEDAIKYVEMSFLAGVNKNFCVLDLVHPEDHKSNSHKYCHINIGLVIGFDVTSFINNEYLTFKKEKFAKLYSSEGLCGGKIGCKFDYLDFVFIPSVCLLNQFSGSSLIYGYGSGTSETLNYVRLSRDNGKTIIFDFTLSKYTSRRLTFGMSFFVRINSRSLTKNYETLVHSGFNNMILKRSGNSYTGGVIPSTPSTPPVTGTTLVDTIVMNQIVNDINNIFENNVAFGLGLFLVYLR